MGRPPIGERAMTEAERKRRLRALAKARTAEQAAALRQAKPEKPAEVDADLIAAAIKAEVAAGDAHQELAQANRKLAQAKAHIAELEAELARRAGEKPRPPLPKTAAELLAQRGRKAERAAAKPKAEKPPLPPDEERERIIKGLKTRVRNLSKELRLFRQYHDEAMTKQGLMSRETRIAVDKVLHPDTRNNATEADIDRACKVWNVWKNDNDKARRKAR
jgi:hypothetical protein